MAGGDFGAPGAGESIGHAVLDGGLDRAVLAREDVGRREPEGEEGAEPARLDECMGRVGRVALADEVALLGRSVVDGRIEDEVGIGACGSVGLEGDGGGVQPPPGPRPEPIRGRALAMAPRVSFDAVLVDLSRVSDRLAQRAPEPFFPKRGRNAWISIEST